MYNPNYKDDKLEKVTHQNKITNDISLTNEENLYQSPSGVDLDDMTAPASDGNHDMTTSAAKDSKSKRGRKSTTPGKKFEFQSDWFPVEWLAFRHYGPFSEQPYEPWSILVSSSSKPIELKDDSELSEAESESERKPSGQLGRSAQRKKRRDELRSDPRYKSGRNVVTIDSADSEKEDAQLGELLSEMSSIRTGIMDNQSVARDANNIRKSELKMNLIARMGLTETEQQALYKSIYDSLG